MARFEDTKQGKCITTTTTPSDLQDSAAPMNMSETLIEAFCTIGEDGNENTSAEDDDTTTRTVNSAVPRFYDLDVLSEVSSMIRPMTKQHALSD